MKRIFWILVCASILAACDRPDRGASPQETAGENSAPRTEAAKLNTLVEEWFEIQLERNPVMATFIGDHRYDDRLANSINPDYIAEQQRLEREYLEKVRALDESKLPGQDRLTRDVFLYDREAALEGFRFPGHLQPVDQFRNPLNTLAQFGSGTNAQPFETAEDYDEWLARLEDGLVWVDQAVINMREGMKRDVVLPRSIVAKVLPQLRAHIVENPEESLFWRPVENLPEEIGDDDRQRIRENYRSAIAGMVVPMYRKLHDFMKNEYLPAARETDGYRGLPQGDDWYRYRIRTQTTTTLSADAIHEMGLDEVARIRGEMKKVMARVGFDGTLAEWFDHVRSDGKFYFDSEDELLDAYRGLRERMEAAAPKLFNIRPKAGFEVRPVEAFRAASAAGASYQRPAPDGSRPGIFYVNTHNLKAQPNFILETLFIHEAIPGHHFQIALQQEVEGLPKFRRFGGYTAYSEGWALYAESLGKRLGFFEDPMQWYGRLQDEQLRAMRLVVDTGLHAKKWSRERAMRFMQENSGLADSDIEAEVERYMAIPGQALSYKIGQFRIEKLRARARAALGERFDIREFHRQVLIDGALPLPVLEAKIERWIDSQRT